MDKENYDIYRVPEKTIRGKFSKESASISLDELQSDTMFHLYLNCFQQSELNRTLLQISEELNFAFVQ